MTTCFSTKDRLLASQLDHLLVITNIHIYFHKSRPVYPYSFAVIPMDSDLKFRCYAGWVKNYGHCPIFPFPHFKLE